MLTVHTAHEGEGFPEASFQEKGRSEECRMQMAGSPAGIGFEQFDSFSTGRPVLICNKNYLFQNPVFIN